jgi:hypothetical protein
MSRTFDVVMQMMIITMKTIEDDAAQCSVNPGGNVLQFGSGYRLSFHRFYVLCFRLSMQIPVWSLEVIRDRQFLNLYLLIIMFCPDVDETSSGNRVRSWR